MESSGRHLIGMSRGDEVIVALLRDRVVYTIGALRIRCVSCMAVFGCMAMQTVMVPGHEKTQQDWLMLVSPTLELLIHIPTALPDAPDRWLQVPSLLPQAAEEDIEALAGGGAADLQGPGEERQGDKGIRDYGQ